METILLYSPLFWDILMTRYNLKIEFGIHFELVKLMDSTRALKHVSGYTERSKQVKELCTAQSSLQKEDGLT